MQVTRIGTLGAASSGVRFPLRAQNSTKKVVTAGSIDATFTTATDGSESTRFTFNTLKAGAAFVPATIDGTAVKFTTAVDVVVGAGGLATTATVGYFFIPTCAGAPTGVPANTYTNCVPLAYDRTNDKIYVRNTTWKASAALA